ncbi:MAG: malonyl-ACP O-methyltransferase BioC [Burkholderiales bacterium]|nr:malonyl-ACP O-methyltransferase BioC [Burkholderiales bacterium]
MRDDAGLVRRAFERAASGYDAVSALPREVGSRMLERLQYVKLAPGPILDAGCATGADSRELRARYPDAHVIALDLALAMLKRAQSMIRSSALICADIARLPIRDESTAMVWSNLALPWAGYGVFAELQRVLAPGGLLMFSTLGPDTLKELRAAWRDGYSHVNEFSDMHDIGDGLVESGFTAPVMEREEITMTYSSACGLLAELKAQGSRTLNRKRRRGLGGKACWLEAIDSYDAMKRDDRVPATFEVIIAHAWKPERRRSDARPIKMYTRRPPDV